MDSVVRRVVVLGNLVKFSHSVFALPFALMMLLVVNRSRDVSWWQFGLLLVCVVAARSAAMAFNRVVDAGFDAENERTRMREIPAGKVSMREALLLVAISSVVFVSASFLLGVHCGVLALPVLLVLLGYSYVKRFSALCHLILGVSLALAPGGVWYALTATWSWKPVSLMVSVMLWVAGFDILYACQDLKYDTAKNLKSMPAKLGVRGARILSGLLHVGAVYSLVIFGRTFELGGWYELGVWVFAALIASQHITIARRGMSCIDQVFFTRNGVASVMLFLFTALDCVWRG
jgi:4-hydroxybenzoate polyprenyltransferase